MKFTIIGCGNAGLIHAAKLYEKNVDVCLLKTSKTFNMEFYEKIKKENGFIIKDNTNNNEYFVKPNIITDDVKQAINFGDVIMIMTTTLQHENIAKLISPYLRDGQILVLCPGYMGSLIFKKYIDKDITYCEWETTAYNGRIINNEYVNISFFNPRNAISCLPSTKNKEICDLLSKYFTNTIYCRKNILESALHNPNMIIHPIGSLFSASRIEYSKGEFWMYKEAFTDSIINVIKDFDISKNMILSAFECDTLDYFDAAKWRNEEDLSKNSIEVFKNFAESSDKGPMKLDHRFLTEDVPIGLGLFISIGKVLNIDVSLQESIMRLSSSLLNKDLSKNTRTIQYLLNKNNVSIEDIKKYIN